MLMVIFGTGASFDSCSTYPSGYSGAVFGGNAFNKDYRPPLRHTHSYSSLQRTQSRPR